MSESPFSVIKRVFFSRKTTDTGPNQSSTQGGLSQEEKTAIPPTPGWISQEGPRLQKASETNALQDSIANGPPSQTPHREEALSNEGTRETVFALKANEGSLPGKIIDDLPIQEARKDLEKAKNEQKKEMAVDTAAARSNAPPPSDTETKTRLPYT